MKPSEILTARGQEKLAGIVQEIRGEERRVLFSNLKLTKVGKRLLNMEARRKAQVAALWELVSEQGSDEAADQVLRAWLKGSRSAMLEAFLDHFGVSQVGGITEEDNWQEKIKSGDIAGGIRLLKERFDPEDAWIYLSFIDIPEIDSSEAIASLLEEKPSG